MPAASEIAEVVVFSKPRSANSFVAATMMRSCLSCLFCSRRPVRAPPLERQVQPSRSGPAGIGEQHAARNITLIRAANPRVHILVTIPIQIRKGDRMTFLQVPEATRQRDLLESRTSHIPEHAIGNHRAQAAQATHMGQRVAGTAQQCLAAIGGGGHAQRVERAGCLTLR